MEACFHHGIKQFKNLKEFLLYIRYKLRIAKPTLNCEKKNSQVPLFFLLFFILWWKRASVCFGSLLLCVFSSRGETDAPDPIHMLIFHLQREQSSAVSIQRARTFQTFADPVQENMRFGRS